MSFVSPRGSAAGCLAAFLWVASVAVPASAQKASAKLPAAALFATSGSKSNTGPLDSVLHATLEKLEVVDVRARPGMDLNAVQLAIDCVSESAQCLRAVATESGTQILIAPSLESTGSELVLSVLRFDMRDGTMKRVARRQPGTSVQAEMLDAVPGLLRELFGLPEPQPAPQPSAAPEEAVGTQLPLIEPPQEPESVSRPMPIGPWLVAGAGVLVLGGGVVFGVMKNSTQEDYDSLQIRDKGDVNEAIELRDRAQTQATVANVLFAIGGAAVVAGGIWLAVELSRPAPNTDDWQTSLEPRVGPGQLGLALVGRGGGL